MHAQEKLVVEANTLSNKETFNAQCSANAGAGANANCKGLVAQETTIKVKELANQKGLITGQKKVDAQLTTSLNNQEGLIQSSEGKVNIYHPQDLSNSSSNVSSGSNSNSTISNNTLRVDNTQGKIEALEAINLNAQALTAEGRIKTPGNFTLNLEEDLILNNTLQNGASQEGAFQIGKDFTFTSSADFINNSQLRVGQNAQISVNNLTNSANAEISATKTFLNTQTLTNRGLVDGNLTVINSAISLTNIGTGRIYGDKLALETLNLENKEEGDSSATIAARNSLEIGANHLLNQNNSLIFSVGSINFAKTLDADFHAVGKSEYVHNYNAQIEAMNEGVDSNTHALTFNTQSVENINNFVKIKTETSIERTRKYGINNDKDFYPANTPGIVKIRLPDKKVGFNIKVKDLYQLYIPGVGNLDAWNYIDNTKTIVKDFVEPSKYKEGKILTAGSIDFGDAKVVNVDSKIIAGQDIFLQNNNIENRETKGYQLVTKKEDKYTNVKGLKCGKHQPFRKNKCIDHYETTLTGYIQSIENPPKEEIPLELHKYLSNSNPNLVPHTIAEKSNLVAVNLDTIALLPSSSLYNINPSSSHGYLVETDPRFTDRRQWLSSDYMTEQLQFDPNHVHKRLGDGFYELQLVNEQINRLTGRQFLGQNSNNIEQYKALMNNGVKFSKDFKLTVGVELSAQQMEKLTTDIVWLVNQEVTLPNGKKTKVLVPKVYLASGSLTTNGYNKTIISANNILGKVKELNNNGTLLAGETLNLSTENLSNEGFIIGNDINLQASHDLINNGGTIEGGDSLTLYAGNNLTIDSAVTERLGNNFSSSAINKMSTIRTTNENSKLVVKSDKNITVSASDIASEGTLSLEAGDNLSITTKKVYNKVNNHSYDKTTSMFEIDKSRIRISKIGISKKDISKTDISKTDISKIDISNIGILKIGILKIGISKIDKVKIGISEKTSNYNSSLYQSQEIGSSISSKGDLSLLAKKDLEVRQGTISSEEGKVSLLAEEGNISLKEGRNIEHKYSVSTEYKKGFLHLKRKEIKREHQYDHDLAEKSSIQGKDIVIEANKGDIAIQGTDINANGKVNIKANDVKITEARNITSEKNTETVTKRGIMLNGSFGVNIGKRKTFDQNTQKADVAEGSFVGSKDNLTINATGKYKQEASKLSSAGDIDISAKSVDILAGQNFYESKSQHIMEQEGLAIALKGSAVDAVQNSVLLGREFGRLVHGGKKTYQLRKQIGKKTLATTKKLIKEAIKVPGKVDNHLNKSLTLEGNQEILAKNTEKAVSFGKKVAKEFTNKKHLIKAFDSTNRILKDARAVDGLLQLKNNFTQDLQNVSASITYSKQKNVQTSESSSTTALSSKINAGGKITIKASGDNKESNINIVGSDVAGKNGTTLKADNNVNILAAKESSQQNSANKSYGYNVGVSASHSSNGNAVGFTAGGNYGKGKSSKETTTWKNSHVGDKNSNTQIISGGDTTLKGAQVKGKGISIETTNLTIESLQDTMEYSNKQKNMDAQVTVGHGASVQGGYKQSKVTADYATVVEQSGLFAGNDGYQIEVRKHTDLKGAVVTSNDQAEKNAKNSFSTDTISHSTIQNYSNYSTKGFGLNGGTTVSGGNNMPKKVFGLNLQQVGQDSLLDGSSKTEYSGITGVASQGNWGIAKGISTALLSNITDKDHQEGITSSYINTSNITIRNDKAQKELSGKTATESIEELHKQNLHQSVGKINAEKLQADFNHSLNTVTEFSNNVNQHGDEIYNKMEKNEDSLFTIQLKTKDCEHVSCLDLEKDNSQDLKKIIYSEKILTEEQAQQLSKVATAGMLNLTRKDKVTSAIGYDNSLATIKDTSLILNRGSAGYVNEGIFTVFERLRAGANLPGIFGASNATRDHAQIAKKLDEYNAYAKANGLKQYDFFNVAHSLGVSGNKNMLNWSEHLGQRYDNTNIEFMHLGGSYSSKEIDRQAKGLFNSTKTLYNGVKGDFVYEGLPVLRSIGLGLIGNNPDANPNKGKLSFFKAHSDANMNINNLDYIYDKNKEEEYDMLESNKDILIKMYPNGIRQFKEVK